MYYYFHHWSKQGAWKVLWLTLLRLPRRLLGLSSIQLDGSHTPAKNGGAAVGHQGRKAARTTNIAICFYESYWSGAGTRISLLE